MFNIYSFYLNILHRIFSRPVIKILAYLPLVSLSSEGSGAAPYYYVYGYEGNSVFSARTTDNFARNGVLYNHPAALESCPDGWHLPSDEEWNVFKGTVDSRLITCSPWLHSPPSDRLLQLPLFPYQDP